MKELLAIQADLVVTKGQYSRFGDYYYRSCDDILEGVKPLLKAHSCTLLLTDKIIAVLDRVYVEATATITNSEGVSLSASASAREGKERKKMDESQLTGAASSYARKYALNGLFALDDNKDADGLDNSKEDVIAKEKEWLNENDQSYSDSVAWITSTPDVPNHIEKLKVRYKISKAVEDLLTDIIADAKRK